MDMRGILVAVAVSACGQGGDGARGAPDTDAGVDGGVAADAGDQPDAQDAQADTAESATTLPAGALADGQAGPDGIAVDATSVYWTNHLGGQVMKCAIAGCNDSPTVLAGGQV
ncbi:MAG TPA: hypothetical protein VIF15_05095, partial [Polyangiaceae bacterium]